MQDIVPPNFNRPMSDVLKIISFCPVCHYHYNPVEAKVLAENDGEHLIYIRCNRCHSSILALIMANNFGISSVGLVTDLDSFEVIKFAGLDEVSGDDVLAVYEMLSQGRAEEVIM